MVLSSPRPNSRQYGFTLIELIVALSVLAILTAVAVPGFTSTLNSGRIRGPTNELVATLQLARMESFRRGQRTVVCRSDDAGSAAPTCNAAAGNWGGWLAFVDVDRDGTFSAGDVNLRATEVLAPAVIIASPVISGGLSRVVFRPDGLAHENTGALLAAQIRVCVATTSPNENARDVVISGGARISVLRRNAAGVCPAPADI